jgi:hypothetical protein
MSAVFGLSGQGCTVPCRALGAFLQTLADKILCVGAEILCETSPCHHRNCPAFVTKNVVRTDLFLFTSVANAPRSTIGSRLTHFSHYGACRTLRLPMLPPLAHSPSSIFEQNYASASIVYSSDENHRFGLQAISHIIAATTGMTELRSDSYSPVTKSTMKHLLSCMTRTNSLSTVWQDPRLSCES